MLGDPVTKPKEYGDIMGYYSRQVGSGMGRPGTQQHEFKSVVWAWIASTQALHVQGRLLERQ